MAYMKRQQAPKNWPIERKGTCYIVRSSQGINKGVPLLLVLRDMLKLAQNRKEAKIILNEKKVLLNNKIVKDEKQAVLLLDNITLLPFEQYYRLEMSNKGKYELKEIKKSEADRKISKVLNKKILKGKKTQLNLMDGRNFLSDTKCGMNDSVVIDLKTNKIEKCLPLKEGASTIVFAGKHAGEKGSILKLYKEKKIAEVKTQDKNINVLIKQLLVIE